MISARIKLSEINKEYLSKNGDLEILIGEKIVRKKKTYYILQNVPKEKYLNGERSEIIGNGIEFYFPKKIKLKPSIYSDFIDDVTPIT